MRRIRSHLTYANVAATLALVIAIAGGTAYAANTIGSSDIIDGQVKSPDIGNNQVRGADVRDDDLVAGGLTGVDIAPDSLTGADVNEQSLQKPCPAGMSAVSTDICYEDSDRGATDFNHALTACAAAGRRLPTLAEAFEATSNWGFVTYWTQDIFRVTDPNPAVAAWAYYRDQSYLSTHTDTNLWFRCVASR